ncbi:NAD(P)/FAD-dependent oxidoreductase [Natrinema sp. 1APR25-10V2]|uniref:NAD(P)/FAD-dependent oxidoreductase n=1 Tax=Natrinema sp. 1APR25-10V2 TaxID=2951081 RepID=UPI00287507C9|nr:NAD(P)/FAD-dependent oxidoreductase [Natrinema sp. 1APR25-10V2]MDS0474629.1 NAD(P)/FAD-dependent oxidoreductase [Natrinema sp. 1APR25-10V2]
MAAYDVIIAGGGPAGLQFARELGHRSTYSVVLLERNAHLSDNDKSTGGTFHQVVQGYDIPESVILDTTSSVVFEGPEASERLPIPNYVLDFPAFLEFLGDDAEEQDVTIFTETRVTEPILEDGAVVGVRAAQNGSVKEFYADIVVDATGPAGVLTTQLGMWDSEAAQRGIGMEFQARGAFDCDSMLFRFDHDFAPGGYAWVFPAGDEVFKTGVCWVNDFYEQHRPEDKEKIDSYVRHWAEADSRWEVDEIHAVHAGVVKSDNSINRRAGDGIVAIGDAVSSLNPLFGEGIRPGMESAEMAADIVLEALYEGDTSRGTLSAYEERWNRERGSKWKIQRIVGELLYDFDADQQNAFVRNVGRLSDEQARRLQRYDLTIRDLMSLYPFRPKDLLKAPALLRHVQ